MGSRGNAGLMMDNTYTFIVGKHGPSHTNLFSSAPLPRTGCRIPF